MYFSSNSNTNNNHVSRYLFTQEVGLSSQNFHCIATDCLLTTQTIDVQYKHNLWLFVLIDLISQKYMWNFD